MRVTLQQVPEPGRDDSCLRHVRRDTFSSSEFFPSLPRPVRRPYCCRRRRYRLVRALARVWWGRSLTYYATAIAAGNRVHAAGRSTARTAGIRVAP